MTEPRKFWKPIPFSQLVAPSEGVEWVWEGILGRGFITLLSAPAKGGKTTLLSLLVKQMEQGGSLLGCNVNRGSVIIISEEPPLIWTIRRDHYGLRDHAEVCTIPFITKPTPIDWLDLLREGYLDIQARKPDLIVFDTLSHLWPVAEENSNSQEQQALMPLRGMSQLGPAILLHHHVGAAGLRTRGATELEAFVDVTAQLDLTTPTDPTCRNRKFTVKGRLTSSPERLEISLSQDGFDYQVLTGNLKPIRSSIWAEIARLLPTETPGITIEQLRRAWPDSESAPSHNTILQTLTRCGDKAGIRRSDGKPVEWWLAN
jgi:hypothetical protein